MNRDAVVLKDTLCGLLDAASGAEITELKRQKISDHFLVKGVLDVQ